MIVDAVLSSLLALVETVLGWLPDAAPMGLGGVGSFVQRLGEFDSLIPILPAINVAMGLLAGLVVFVVIRLVLVVINIVWW